MLNGLAVPNPPYGGGASDAFVTCLNQFGQFAQNDLSFSVLLGGDDIDVGRGIAVDANRRVHLTGFTRSQQLPTLTVVGSTYRATGAPFGQDAFVARLVSSFVPPFVTLDRFVFLGGSGAEEGRAIAVPRADNPAQQLDVCWVTGVTESFDFSSRLPVGTPGSDFLLSGTRDAFVTGIDWGAPSNITFLYASFLGGDAEDEGNGIFVRSALFGSTTVVVTGATTSPHLPQEINSALGGGDGFAYALQRSVSPPVFTELWSRFLGGTGFDEATSVWGFVAPGSGLNVFVAGSTQSANFSPLIGSGFGSALHGPSDAFLMRLNINGGVVLDNQVPPQPLSVLIGGDGDDAATGVVVDTDYGDAYVVGRTGSINFPTVGGSFGMNYGGATDGFVTLVRLTTTQ